MSDHIPINQTSSFRDAMTGNWYDTSLSNAFFSSQNIKIIQNGIRAGVYKKSNNQYVIGEQNGDELKIVMRSVFLQYSKNLPTNISEQIAALNKTVLDYTISQVFGEAQGYMTYKKDASTLVVPIAHPILSSTFDKQLELKHWF
jgi:lantibiotic modifying enzyme